MSRPVSFIKVSGAELAELDSALKSSFQRGGLRYRRRLQIIWFSLQNWTVKRIASYLKTPERTVWKWRRIYKEKGLAGLRGKYFSHKL